MLDKFDSTREKIWGKPGFQTKKSTVTPEAFLGIPQGDWIVETVKTDEEWAVFLRHISQEESLRLVLPGKVVESMFRHRESIMKLARKARAQRAAETREKRALSKLEAVAQATLKAPL